MLGELPSYPTPNAKLWIQQPAGFGPIVALIDSGIPLYGLPGAFCAGPPGRDVRAAKPLPETTVTDKVPIASSKVEASIVESGAGARGWFTLNPPTFCR